MSKPKDEIYFRNLLRDKFDGRTGYPLDLLTDDVDLEGDLGIDSLLVREVWAKAREETGLSTDVRPPKTPSIRELAKLLSEEASKS